jgi:hypothetical protein
LGTVRKLLKRFMCQSHHYVQSDIGDDILTHFCDFDVSKVGQKSYLTLGSVCLAVPFSHLGDRQLRPTVRRVFQTF